MSWTVGEFRTYPVFNGRFGDSAHFPDPVISAHLQLADLVHGCQWGNEAIALLVAHRLEMMVKTGLLPTASGTDPSAPPPSQMERLEQFLAVGSTISSLSVSQGSSSVSFNQPNGSESSKSRWGIGAGEDLGSTLWGRFLMSMRPNTFGVGFVI